MKQIRVIIVIISIIALNCSSNKKAEIYKAFMGFNGKYIVYISKKDFSLEVYDKSFKRIAGYKIGYGKNPDRKTKLYEGDKRTPEGTYKINEIFSMNADKDSSSYKKLRALNRVYFKAGKGFHKYGLVNVDLGDNVYGPRYFGINYPNKIDKKRYKSNLEKGIIKPINGKIPGIGFGIAIHGNSDKKSIGRLCSSGCIRMYNTDIVELGKYIHMNIPVIISSN